MDQNKALHKKITGQLEVIAATLAKQYNKLDKIGLKYGLSGIALFFFMYYKSTGKERYRQTGIDIVALICEKVNDGFSGGRIFEQYGDFVILLEFLEQADIYTFDFEDAKQAIDKIHKLHLEVCLKNDNYDIVDGALASGYYYLHRLHKIPEYKQVLVHIAEWLITISNSSETGALYWKSKLFQDDRSYIGISHGSASVMNFLLKLVDRKIIAAETYKPYILQAVAYIEQSALDISKSENFYPIYRVDDEQASPIINRYRLNEWCYGDLGVLYVLLKSAVLFNNHDLYDTTKKKLDYHIHSTNREMAVADAGFVHGAAGAYYLYHKIYQITKEIACENTAVSWLEDTFSFFNNEEPEAILGYMAKYVIDSPLGSNTGLMSGWAGIGLCYMTFLNKELDTFENLLYT